MPRSPSIVELKRHAPMAQVQPLRSNPLSVPSLRKTQLVEKSIYSVELFIDPKKPLASYNQVDAAEKIILIVDKYSLTDAICRMYALNKQTSTYQRRVSENVEGYIEICTLDGQAYINITNSDKFSAESRRLSMMLIAKENIPSSTFNSVIKNLVQS